MADDGRRLVAGQYPFRETVQRLEAALTQRGLTIFARIDHAANAAEVNLPLRPTLLVIFGNPKGGTVLMQDRQSVGLDLPLKVLVWEDAKGVVQLSYNSPAWIAERHGLGSGSTPAVTAMTNMMEEVVREAAV